MSAVILRRLGLGIALLSMAALAAPLAAQIPGGSLAPADVEKFVTPLVIPPQMPPTDRIPVSGGKNIEYYEIAVRQFQQQVLPPSHPSTTVWSYGSVDAPGTVADGGSFHYPAFTIEARWRTPVRVKWINELVADPEGCRLPSPPAGACEPLAHLLPVDQTLHWANPVGECYDAATGLVTSGRDCRGFRPDPYLGPVPIITHVHGAETFEWSDGYPEAWYVPASAEVPYPTGSFHDTYRMQAAAAGLTWEPGSATFEYPNDMDAATLWYHDHTLGITRLNVYAGPAGFYLLRGGPGDEVRESRRPPHAGPGGHPLGGPPGQSGRPATLPGPAPALDDRPGVVYREIPIVIQDRSFNADGSLFYPDHRAFFEGLSPSQLQIPFVPDDVVYDGAVAGPSDVPPIWNPEFFGNMMVVNGVTWPYLEVEPVRYRFRFLNGSQSRFLVLQTDTAPPMPLWQIGADGGFLPEPQALERLLLGPAERADVIVDFGRLPPGTVVHLLNLGPDEPFGGGVPGLDFEPADPGSTGVVLQFRVVGAPGRDRTTPPQRLVLPQPAPLGPATVTRRLSLNEEESATVRVTEEDGDLVLDAAGERFAPTAALLGVLGESMEAVPLLWSDPITENPLVGATEVWEIYNLTEDAHPIHIHLVQFEIVNRQAIDADEHEHTGIHLEGPPWEPEPWELGRKDTVIAYPEEVTRVKARFDLAGLFVWHCHILEHEDHEMMRPYCVGSTAACQQHGLMR